MNCDWVKDNVTLYVYDELADDARYELEQHVHRCAACAGELQAVGELKAKLAAPQQEPSPNLLAAARMRLQEALETAEQHQGWRRWVLDPAAWLRQVKFAPALAAVIFIVGFAAGIGATYRIGGAKGTVQPSAGGAVSSAAIQTTDAPIAAIRGITQQPGSNKVDIQYDALIPQNVQGSLDDPRVQHLLLLAARNNTNSGVRMDSVDLLMQNPEDQRVREVLIYALRYDNNPGVRLKALEGLGPYVKGDVRVRNAVLEALVKDANPGVRTAAIQLLNSVRADASVRQVLEHLAQQDPNEYIRGTARSVLASTRVD